MSMYKLRGNQLKAKTMVRERFVAGDKKVMVWAMTGYGKGILMSDFAFNSIQNGNEVLTIIRRSELIHQTVANYKKYHNIDSSPIMGSVKGRNPDLKSQVGSIDTLSRRIGNPLFEYLKRFNVIIIDECHDFTSEGYHRFVWWLEGYNPVLFTEKQFELEKKNFKKLYVGLTATPFRVGKRTHTFWDSVVKPCEAHELRDQGFLVPIRVFAPTKIDTKGIRISGKTGDFDQKVLFERVSQMAVIGDVVGNYQKYGEGRAAICFCVNTRHSQIIAEAFRRVGIPAIHCDADHSKAERDAAVKGLKDGTYRILTNCNIFSTGFDAPFVSVEIGARPTDSENLYIQQVGRVLRPYKVCKKCGTEYGGDPECYRCGSSETSFEKDYAIYIDHGNNADRFGMPYDIRHAELEPLDIEMNRSRTSRSTSKGCPICFAYVDVYAQNCYSCNYDFAQSTLQNQEGQIVTQKGELAEVDSESVKLKKFQKLKERYNTYKRIEMLHRWQPMAKFYKLYEEFDEFFLDNCLDFGVTGDQKRILKETKDNLVLKKMNEQVMIDGHVSQKVFT